jgi:hypothetical protein
MESTKAHTQPLREGHAFSVQILKPALQESFGGYPRIREQWSRTTSKLVDLSAVAFVFLLLPQLVKNAQALAAGNGSSLVGLSWVVRPFNAGPPGFLLSSCVAY